MPPTTQQSDNQGHAATEHNTGSTQEQTSTPSIHSLDDVISIIGQHSGEGEAYRALHLDAEKLRNAKQNELRKLCKPWGVTLHAKNAQGLYSKRGDEELKRDIQNKMIQRARELQRQRGTATRMRERSLILKVQWQRCCMASMPAAMRYTSWQELSITHVTPRIASVSE